MIKRSLSRFPRLPRLPRLARLLLFPLLLLLSAASLFGAELPAGMALISSSDADKLGFSGIWTIDVKTRPDRGEKISFAAVLDDALVLVETPSNLVTAINLKDGSVRWRKIIGERTDRVLAIVKVEVRVPKEGGGTKAEKEWDLATDSQVTAIVPETGKLIKLSDLDYGASVAPAVSSGLLIFGGVNGRVFSHDPILGYSTWSYQLRGRIAVRPALGVVGPKDAEDVQDFEGVLAADISGNIAMLKADDGQLVWSNRTFANIKGEPVLRKRAIYIASTDMSLYCFDAFTGQDRWIFRATEPLSRTPAVLGEFVFQPLPSKRLVCLNAMNGREVWRINSEPRSMLPIARGLLLDVEKSLQLIDPPTGKITAEIPVPTGIQYVITGPDKGLILVSPAGQIMRLNAKP